MGATSIVETTNPKSESRSSFVCQINYTPSVRWRTEPLGADVNNSISPADYLVLHPALPGVIQSKEIAMMEQRTDEFNQAKGKMANDIKTVITDAEDLLKAAANVSGAGFAVAREKVDEKLSSAKARLVDASRPAVDKARRTAAAANGYVHGNPWTVIGVAAAAGALIGFLAARRPRGADSSTDLDS